MYQKSKDCFKENTQRFHTAMGDPSGYNLNAGLFQLVEALESDMADLKGRLHRIEQLLHALSSS